MTTHAIPASPTHVFRVDKFVVPTEARSEFLSRVRDTHALLKTLPGFVQDWIFEQTGGPGRFNLVTTVEWSSQDAIERAKADVSALHQRTGFNAGELMARLGITADVGVYASATAPTVETTATPRPPYRGRWLRA